MALKYSDFQNKWLGQVTYYGATIKDIQAGTAYQCVCYVKQYLKEATGRDYQITMGNAIDWATKPVKALSDVSFVVPINDTQEGDIVIKTPNHIGIATGAVTPSQIQISEQNGATGNGRGVGNDRIRLRYINRSEVAAVRRLNDQYRPKKLETGDNGIVGKTVKLPASVDKWAYYKPGTELPVKRKNRAGELSPKKWSGLSYKIDLVVAPNTVEVTSPSLGKIWLYLDKDAQIV